MTIKVFHVVYNKRNVGNVEATCSKLRTGKSKIFGTITTRTAERTCPVTLCWLLDLICQHSTFTFMKYRGVDKSLTRPGRKQATATEDYDFHISYLLS